MLWVSPDRTSGMPIQTGRPRSRRRRQRKQRRATTPHPQALREPTDRNPRSYETTATSTPILQSGTSGMVADWTHLCVIIEACIRCGGPRSTISNSWLDPRETNRCRTPKWARPLTMSCRADIATIAAPGPPEVVLQHSRPHEKPSTDGQATVGLVRSSTRPTRTLARARRWRSLSELLECGSSRRVGSCGSSTNPRPMGSPMARCPIIPRPVRNPSSFGSPMMNELSSKSRRSPGQLRR